MDVLSIGAACVDRIYRADAAVLPATSNPARARRGYGGVARNVAESLARLGRSVALLTAVGDDPEGAALAAYTAAAGVDVEGWLRVPGRATGEYAAILQPDGELVVGACDAGPVGSIGAAEIARWEPRIARARWVFADGNLGTDALSALLALRARGTFRLAIDAVSSAKARRLPGDLRGADLLVLNAHHLAHLGAMPEARAVVLTRGAGGVEVVLAGETTHLAARPADPVDVTGAGDALVAGTLHRLLDGEDVVEAVRGGMLLAALTVESTSSVRPDLSDALLRASGARA